MRDQIPSTAQSSESPRLHRRSGISVWEILVVISIIAVLFALLLPSVRRGGEPARRTQCKNNLKQIALALHNYHDVYGMFPPAYTVDSEGRPMHSWRTLILPFIDQGPLANEIDLSKPWDDPANAAALSKTPSVFRCPSLDMSPTLTTYVAATGSGACFYENHSRSLSDIIDGASNTVMVVEVSQAAAVPWMAPQDGGEWFLLNDLSDETNLSHERGTQAAMVDGSVRFLSTGLSGETRAALISIDANDDVGEF